MKLIKELTEKEVIKKSYSNKKLKLRRSVRAIILYKNKIAIMHSPNSKYYYYKLPGGGIEKNESIKNALKREIREEIGANIEIKKEIGKIIEYKNKIKRKHISYCYLAIIVGKIGKPRYTEEEKEAGYKVKWLKINSALKLFELKTNNYYSKFNKERDKLFLLEYKKIKN